jgi:imidazolonepropionase-like amidohydrolase
MVFCGLTPAEAIVAGTRRRRRFSSSISWDGRGRKSADFIVLDANPLDDILNTRKIDRSTSAARPLIGRP